MRMIISACLAIGAASVAESAAADPPRVVEGYPEEVVQALARQDDQLIRATKNIAAPFSLIVPRYQRWLPGQLVRVAFLDGSTELRERIEAAALSWIGPNAANLQLSFRDAAGNFLTWQASDEDFAAEIRISFAGNRRWSLVGRNAINTQIPGGRPGEASMNLGGFADSLPVDWRVTVLHEFGHALGFEHEHQNPAAACGFRFYNDSGYVPTQDADEVYVEDSEHRRPGLYTYLGGKPNSWKTTEVDFNLRAISVSSAFHVSAFDRLSIMRYSFPDSFFEQGGASPCAGREATDLSAMDLAGVRAVYPRDFDARSALNRMILQRFLPDAADNAELAASLRERLD